MLCAEVQLYDKTRLWLALQMLAVLAVLRCCLRSLWHSVGVVWDAFCLAHADFTIRYLFSNTYVAICSNSKHTLMYLVGSCLCLDRTLCFAGKIQDLQSLLHCNHNCTNLSEEIYVSIPNLIQFTCLNTQCIVGISNLHSLASSFLNHLVDQSIARVMVLLINLAKVYPLWNKWIEWGEAF